MKSEDDDTAGLAVVVGFLVIIWLLRTLFKAADQSK